MRVENCVNLDDLRKIAKRRLPKLIYDFIEGGCDDERGLDRNESAFARYPLVPRYMVDMSVRDMRTTIFGREYDAPFGIAPTGGIGNFRRGADMLLAAAARDANIPFIMSGAATASMETMHEVAPEHGWYQLYPARDKAISDDMIARAKSLGIPALVVTVDVPAPSNRERNTRNGFGRPLKLSLATKLDAARRPAWLKDYLSQGLAMLENWQPYAPAGASAEQVGEFVAEQMPIAPTWADIERYREHWEGPLILKGVLRASDAVRAAQVGVDGLMVSNHGARQVDRAPSPLEVLPHIVEAVGERMTVMLDSGIRRGSDVLTALALGAQFVFMGRGTLYGVIAGGGPGATKALSLMQGEVDSVMAQIGCTSLHELGRDFIEYDPERLRQNR